MTRLPPDDFRSTRAYLPDEAFALVSDKPDPPIDRIDEKDWKGMIALADDVVLRTTSFQGKLAGHCYDAWAAVVDTFPQKRFEEPPVLRLCSIFRITFNHQVFQQCMAFIGRLLQPCVLQSR